MFKPFDKIVVITRKTALEELIERFNTESQVHFYLENMGASFAGYQGARQVYHAAPRLWEKSLPTGRTQYIERPSLANFLFGDKDVVVTLGPAGLVINT